MMRMPSFRALSARLSVMPEPGNTTSLIGRTSSKRSLRLKGAALPSRVQSGLKAICVTLRLLAQQGACRVRCTPRDRTGGVRSTMIAGGLAHLSKDAQFAERGGVDWQGTEFPNSVLAKKRALLDGDGSH